MKPRRINFVLALFTIAAGCGFESRVEGTWQPVGLDPQVLVDRSVPRSMAKTLASASFVAEDGVVYVGLKQEQATLVRYEIVSERSDCATVRLETPQTEPKQSEQVQACLRDDELTLRHEDKGDALAVTFRRAP